MSKPTPSDLLTYARTAFDVVRIQGMPYNVVDVLHRVDPAYLRQLLQGIANGYVLDGILSSFTEAERLTEEAMRELDAAR